MGPSGFFISANRVFLAASGGGLLSLFLTGFVVLRPNRLAGGDPLLLFQMEGIYKVPALLGWTALVLLSLVRIPARLRDAAAGTISLLMVPLFLAAAGDYAEIVSRSAGPVARVSLGPAFWISMFALTALISEAWRRPGFTRWLNTAAAAAATAATTILLAEGRMSSLSLFREFANRQDRFLAELGTHVLLASAAVTLALTLGIPIGILAHRRARLRGPLFLALNSLQTIPSLALFGVLIPLLAALTAAFPALEKAGIRAIGTAPALAALTVYSLLPVTRNTFVGLDTVDPGIVEAGRGMGVTGAQLLFSVELPIASPVILSGIRVALVQAVGLTAVAALIGAGGLGVFIFQGLGQAATDLILLGAIPTIFIAVLADGLMATLSLVLKPKGLG